MVRLGQTPDERDDVFREVQEMFPALQLSVSDFGASNLIYDGVDSGGNLVSAVLVRRPVRAHLASEQGQMGHDALVEHLRA